LGELAGVRVPLDYAFSLIRSERDTHLRRVLATCLANERVTQAEVNVFNHVADALRIQGPDRAKLQYQLHRRVWMTRVSDGELPHASPVDVIPQSDERFYYDARADYKHVRASGSWVRAPGRLLLSNKKIRFIGDGNQGWELNWSKIVQIDTYTDAFGLRATQNRGSGIYFVDDPELIIAILDLALRTSRRQHVPTTTVSRTIPQAVKNAVWARDRGECVECGASGPGAHLEYNHDIPWSKGGASTVDNINLLCRTCNARKGDRI
jgi:hypothetical protein